MKTTFSTHSKVITSVGYDEDTKTLFANFRNSGLYAYLNVPEHFFVGFRKAGSKGKYLRYFKTFNFPCVRVEDYIAAL